MEPAEQAAREIVANLTGEVLPKLLHGSAEHRIWLGDAWEQFVATPLTKTIANALLTREQAARRENERMWYWLTKFSPMDKWMRERLESERRDPAGDAGQEGE